MTLGVSAAVHAYMNVPCGPVFLGGGRFLAMFPYVFVSLPALSLLTLSFHVVHTSFRLATSPPFTCQSFLLPPGPSGVLPILFLFPQ